MFVYSKKMKNNVFEKKRANFYKILFCFLGFYFLAYFPKFSMFLAILN